MWRKPFLDDVQREILASVKREAFWPYAGLRVSEALHIFGMVMGFAILCCYVLTAAFLHQHFNATPEDIKKLAEAFGIYLFTFLGVGCVALFFYNQLRQQLQPVVRAAARNLNA